MELLLSTAASGMRSRTEALDMLANNIANADTAGYKADEESYNLYFGQNAWDGYNDGRPAAAEMPVIQKSWTNLSQGALVPTGSSSDLALASEGFFVVQTPSGPLYTRNGHFKVTSNGELETTEGYSVTDASDQPITLVPGRDFQIKPTGEIQQNGQLVGKLKVVSAASLDQLSKQGASYFRLAPNGSVQPVANPEVMQGKIESSNVPAAQGAVKLVGVMRQFEMLQKAVQIAADMNKQTFDNVARVNG